MPKDSGPNALDADIILRVPGPPRRDFRAHKLILSLASPVFKDMFSLPQPTAPTSEGSNATDIVEVMDPPQALSIVLKIIYPNTSPSLNDNLDTIVECLVIVEKYEMRGAISQLRDALSRANVPLRVYAIASRFGFTDLAESTFRKMLPSVNLAGVPQLPDDFRFITAAAYHKLIGRQTHYWEMAAEAVKRTPLKRPCRGCRGGCFTKEVFRLRLAHLIIKGTPVEVQACVGAWVNEFGPNPECEDDCVPKFIRAAISQVYKSVANPGERKPILKKA